MRHRVWIPALTVVALAAWWLLDGAPRRGGDGVHAAPAAPVSPAAARPTELREVDGPQPEAGPVPNVAPAAQREVVARARRPVSIPEFFQGEVGRSEAATGSVTGFLRSESGGWNDLPGLLRGGVVVELFFPGDPRAVRRAQLEPISDPDGSTAIAFRLDDVPVGSYRLEVTSLAPEVWEPASQPIDAPERDIVVWCRDRIGRVRLAFDVRDAETGTQIDGWSASALRQTVTRDGGVLLQAAELELETFPVDGRIDWSIVAPGYAPAFGDEGHFAPAAEGVWSTRVDLRRGWAARVVALARDPLMRPIEGARIELDGRFAGLTGARGWLDVALPAAPGALAVTWNGVTAHMEAVPAADSNEARHRGQMLPIVLQ